MIHWRLFCCCLIIVCCCAHCQSFFLRSLLCFVVHCVLSSFAIILLGSKELVVLLLLCSECHPVAVIIFLTVPWVGMQFLSVAFPGHTHLLFTKVLTDLFNTSLLHCHFRIILFYKILHEVYAAPMADIISKFHSD